MSYPLDRSLPSFMHVISQSKKRQAPIKSERRCRDRVQNCICNLLGKLQLIGTDDHLDASEASPQQA